MPIPEFPTVIDPNLPPGVMPEHPGPLRYPWEEIADVPTPVFARQAPPTPKIGEALIQSEVLPAVPLVSPSNVMRY